MSNPEVDSFLQPYSAKVRDLVTQTRAFLEEATAGSLTEFVDPPSRIIAYGFSSKYRDLVCAIAPYSAHINLIFSRGVDLSDPHGLLTGSGKKARHVRIDTIADLKVAELRDLIRSALALAGS